MNFLLTLLLSWPGLSFAETVRFKSNDGWALEADYQAGKKSKPAAILVHGLAAGRGEYDAFAKELRKKGWTTLALDLRGHGGSAAPAGFETIQEWDAAVFDVLAAAKFLETKGVQERQVVLIGGSLGANLCAKVFAALPRARRLVLLSPGADYRGVRLARLDRRAVLAASRQDEYSWSAVQQAKAAFPSVSVLEARSGHGAQMLAEPAFLNALLKAL